MPQPDGQARTEQLHVRVTPDEKRKVIELADLDEYESTSALLRDRAIEPLIERRDRLVDKAQDVA